MKKSTIGIHCSMGESQNKHWGAWMAESVRHFTFNLGSSHDLTVCEFQPCVCADIVEPV